MKRLFLILPVMLAACSSSPVVTATNASASEVQEKVKAAKLDTNFTKPGAWATTVTLTEMNAPGMPPAMAEQMKAGLGKPETRATCVKADDKGPKADFLSTVDKSCRYENFRMGDGKIDATMNCDDPMGKRHMTLAGTYGPETWKIDIGSSAKAGGAAAGPMAAMGEMSMKMKIEAKRTGECTGKEQG